MTPLEAITGPEADVAEPMIEVEFGDRARVRIPAFSPLSWPPQW